MNDVQAWDRLCFGAAAEHEAHDSGVAAAAANGAGAELTCMSDGIFANLMALDQVRGGGLGGGKGGMMMGGRGARWGPGGKFR